MPDDDLKRVLDSIREQNAAAHAETRRQFSEVADRLTAETRHYFDLAMESTKHEIRLVAESVTQNTEEIRRARTDLDEKITRSAAETQAMIKFSHVELDRRMSALEDGQRGLEETVADLRARVDRIESGTH